MEDQKKVYILEHLSSAGIDALAEARLKDKIKGHVEFHLSIDKSLDQKSFELGYRLCKVDDQPYLDSLHERIASLTKITNPVAWGLPATDISKMREFKNMIKSLKEFIEDI